MQTEKGCLKATFLFDINRNLTIKIQLTEAGLSLHTFGKDFAQ